MNDVLFHSTDNKGTWHSWIADIIQPSISLACGKKIVLFTELKDKENNLFDRNKFYGLSGIHNVPLSYYWL